jgi:hypothetical protein
MSNAATPAATAQQMPLFFKRIAAVNAQNHGELRLDRSAGFRFAASAQSVPVGLTEMDTAAQHYTILFTSGANPMPVVLLGLREGENLFVRPDGTWQPDAYVPAYVRCFPFIYLEEANRKQLFMGLEPDAEHFKTGHGQPLFEDGRPAQAYTDATNFCKAYRESVVASGVFGRALDKAGVLVDDEATITFTAGGAAKVRGFKLVKPEKLAEVDDATFLEWRSMGWLAAIYAHLHSSGRWSRLIELAAPRMAAVAA